MQPIEDGSSHRRAIMIYYHPIPLRQRFLFCAAQALTAVDVYALSQARNNWHMNGPPRQLYKG